MKFMRAMLPTFITFVLLAGISPLLLAEDSPLAVQSTFKAHCIKCHGKKGKVKGKVNLLKLKSADDLQAKPELLQTLLIALKDREMPPKDEPVMPEAERKHMIVRFQAMLRPILKTPRRPHRRSMRHPQPPSDC